MKLIWTHKKLEAILYLQTHYSRTNAWKEVTCAWNCVAHLWISTIYPTLCRSKTFPILTLHYVNQSISSSPNCSKMSLFFLSSSPSLISSSSEFHSPSLPVSLRFRRDLSVASGAPLLPLPLPPPAAPSSGSIGVFTRGSSICGVPKSRAAPVGVVSWVRPPRLLLPLPPSPPRPSSSLSSSRSSPWPFFFFFFLLLLEGASSSISPVEGKGEGREGEERVERSREEKWGRRR